jgi:transposase InsO family protein
MESQLRQRVTDLATQYGRYGYRRITVLLREEGWRVNHKRIERIWAEEGLKVPTRQPKRRRLWLNEASCIRLRLTHPMHVWSYDMVMDRTSNGKAFRILNILDEYSRECLACVVERQITSQTVLETLCELFVRRGIPAYIRSDNGSEFTADTVRRLLADLGVRTLFIEPGSSWENGYVESFKGKMKDELLNRELIDTLWEAKTLCGQWVRQYNTVKPHSALGYRPPAPEARMPPALGELIFVT